MPDDTKTDDDQKQDDKVDDKTDDKSDDADDQDTGDGADDKSDELGDKGKQALDRMKGKLNLTRSELREFKALGLTAAEIKELVDAKKTGGDDDKVDADKIREEARREAKAEATKERVLDKIEVHAAKGFADAEDAVAILLRTHEAEDFLDGDKIDVEAIQEALDDLLEKKPHLAAQGGKRFQGKADGGKRKADRPDQLTRDDLKRMSPKEITKAKADGRLADLLGTK